MPASSNPASVVRASWAKLLEVAENQRSKGGKYIITGDMNAEPEEATTARLAAGTRRRVSDELLRQMHEMAGLRRMGDMTATYHDKCDHHTVIDATYASLAASSVVERFRLTPGIDGQENTHDAMVFYVKGTEWAAPAGAVYRPRAMEVCGGDKSEKMACIERYKSFLPTTYVA